MVSIDCSNHLKQGVEMSKKDATNFSRKLASNEKEVREKSLEDVRNWMSGSPFDEINEGDMMKLWMGLYMSMYMADKPLVQEKLAVNLASLVDCLSDSNEVFMFISAFFKIMRREWSSIDRVRIDKFYMLIRVMLGRTLLYLQQQQWDECIIDQYQQLMSEALNTSQTSALADGITFHIVDVFLTELKKVSDIYLSKNVIVILLSPFVHLLATTPDLALRCAISDTIFEPLAVGIETGVVQKLSISPIAMSTEFLKLAKDPSLPRSTANRKCLYQLYERFAKTSDSAKQNGIAIKTEHTKSRKRKGDTGGKETAKGSRRSKQMTNNKESPHHISTSSDNGDMVTMDTTNSNTSIHHSNSSDTVVDVTRDAKRIKKLRKRSLPAMNSSNDVDGGSKAKKKHKSLDSRLVDTITKKDYVTTSLDRRHKHKRHSLPNPSSSSESSVLFLEANKDTNDRQRVISSPLRMTTRSGLMVGRHEQVSKKVNFALQENIVYDQQTAAVQKKYDHSLKPAKSVLKAFEHVTVTAAPSNITTRRKSSRFLKHS